VGNLQTENTPNNRTNAMLKFGNQAHNSVARSIGYALTGGAEADWWTFSANIFARLTRSERAALAYAALMAMDERDAHDTASAALFGYVGVQQ